MLTGNGSPHFYRFLKYFTERRFGPSYLRAIPFVGQACGMKIAVAGVAENSKEEIMVLSNRVNALKHSCYLASRNR